MYIFTYLLGFLYVCIHLFCRLRRVTRQVSHTGMDAFGRYLHTHLPGHRCGHIDTRRACIHSYMFDSMDACRPWLKMEGSMGDRMIDCQVPGYVQSTGLHSTSYVHVVHAYILVHAYMHAWMRTYIDTYMHACMCVYRHTCIHTYVPTCIHAYMHTCRHAHAYMCIYIYVQIHAPTHLPIYLPTYLPFNELQHSARH